jgi:hypothetical protein
MKPRLLCICPDLLDGCSWYRGSLPLSEACKVANWDIYFAQDASWLDIARCDAVFMQRPCSVPEMRVAINAKSIGKPLWVDYDDLITHVPETNGASEGYADPRVRALCDEFFDMSDVMTVSTVRVAAMAPEKAQVIPNAIPDFIWGKWHDTRNKIVCWRGSATHVADMELMRESVAEFLQQHPDWSFAFVGHKPWWSAKLPQRQVMQLPYVDVLTHHANLINMAPSVMWVPLEDNLFNRAKSNCAWLEATAAGAIVVASKLPEFAQPGVDLTFDNDFSGSTDIHLLKESRYWRQSKDAIEDSYLLSKVNQKRVDILCYLLNRC